MTQPWWQRLLFLPPQAARSAPGIDALHGSILLLTVVSATIVFAFAAMCVWRYRTHGADQTQPLRWGTLAETIPSVGLLILFLGLFAVGYNQYVTLRSAPSNTLDIYVTAKQWMWTFTYPDGHSTINVLTVPADTPVKLVMQSRDVIHSFFVPAFRLKQDVLPGRVTTLWFTATAPGTYTILCAEYCGLEHATMRATVTVQPAATAARATPPGSKDLVRQGALAFTRHGCDACHGDDEVARTGPPLRKLSNRDSVYINASIMDPLASIVAGYAPVMPSYAGIIDPSDVAALIAYVQSLATREATP